MSKNCAKLTVPNWYPRLIGALTFGYGLYIIARPISLFRPAGMLGPSGELTSKQALIGRGVGVRDTTSGLSLLLAPPGRPLQAAVGARVASDLVDTVGLGLTAPRRKLPLIWSVTLGWAAVCGLGFFARSAQPNHS